METVPVGETKGQHRFVWQLALLALIIVALVNLRLTHFDRSEYGLSIRYILRCAKGVSYASLMESIILYQLLCFLHSRLDRWPLIYLLPSAVFAFFAIEGRYFETSKAVDFFSEELFFSALSWLSFLGYLAVYYLSFVLFDYLIEHIVAPRLCNGGGAKPANRLLEWVESHPFQATVILLGLMAVPLYAISYPALFLGDTRYQLAQALGKSQLNGQHPLVHTFFIGLCMQIGLGVFHSENVGIFLVVLIQGSMLILSLAFCVHTLVKILGMPVSAALIVPLAFALHPRCQQYLTLATKDSFYCPFLIAFLCCTIRQVLGHRSGRLEFVVWATLGVGMCMARREAIFVLVPSLALLALVKGFRIRSCALIAVILGVTLLFNRVVFPSMGAMPSNNTRLYYSFLFQQTARYLREHPDDVTQEERDTIDAMVEYDGLADIYEEKLYDNVKNAFRPDVTSQQLHAYLAVWAQMFTRHPDSYIHAITNFKYEYLYPSEDYSSFYSVDHSKKIMNWANEMCDLSFTQTEANYQRFATYESLREGWYRLFGLGIIVSSFMFVYAYALMAFFALRRRMWMSLLLLLIPILQIMVLLVGPTGGYYFRYTFPLATIMPLYLLLICRDTKGAEDIAGKHSKSV